MRENEKATEVSIVTVTESSVSQSPKEPLEGSDVEKCSKIIKVT